VVYTRDELGTAPAPLFALSGLLERLPVAGAELLATLQDQLIGAEKRPMKRAEAHAALITAKHLDWVSF
jgi:hypothetical protein